jgi:hypothetical protein
MYFFKSYNCNAQAYNCNSFFFEFNDKKLAQSSLLDNNLGCLE